MKKKSPPSSFLHVLGGLSLVLAACSTLWMLLSSIGQTPLLGCGVDSACSEVLGSTWSKIGGIPLSFLGMTAYVALLFSARSEFRFRRKSIVVPFLATGVTLAAAWLLAVQVFAIGALCPWCCATHAVAVIGAGLVMVSRSGLSKSEKPNIVSMPVWAAPAMAAVAVAGLGVVQIASDHTVSETAELGNGVRVMVENDRPVLALHDGEFEIDTAALPVTGAEHPVHWIVTLSDPTCEHCRDLQTFLDEEGQAADTAYVHLPVARNQVARHLQHDLLVLFRTAPELHATAVAGLKNGSISDQPARFRSWINAQWNETQSFETAWKANREWARSQILLAMNVLEANKTELGKVSIPQMMHGDQIILGQPDSMEDIRETFAMGAEVMPVPMKTVISDDSQFAFALPASTRTLLGGMSFVLLFAAGLGFYLLRRRRIMRWVALFTGSALAAGSVSTVLAAGTVVPENTIFIPQTDLIACVDYDGTAPFSAADPLDDGAGTHTPGDDLNETNNVVRTYDLIQYSTHWNVNEQDTSNVIITMMLPPDPTRPDDPDPNAMFINWTELPAGCIQPNLESAAAIANKDSYITDDGKTLVCNVGDAKEGTSGTIRAIAQVGLNLDGKIITMDSTITTDDSPPVDGNSLETTISGAPAGDWVKGRPKVYRDVTNAVNGLVGMVMVYPIALVPGGPGGIIGSAPMVSPDVTVFDHFHHSPPNTIIADPAWFTNRTVCGGYDFDKVIDYDDDLSVAGDNAVAAPFTDPAAVGATANNTIPVTIGCALDAAASAANGYPVVRFDFSNYDAGILTPDASTGGPNTKGVPLAAQVAFWSANADYIAHDGGIGTVWNAISATNTAVTGTAADGSVSDPASIVPIDIHGNAGTVPENIVGDNNFVGTAYRLASSLPGKTFRHYTTVSAGPYQENVYSDTLPGTPVLGHGDFYHRLDHRNLSRGGLGSHSLPPRANFYNAWQGDHTVSRGETLVVSSRISTFTTHFVDVPASQIHHDHINLCNHFDNANMELVDFASPTFDVIDTSGFNTTVPGWWQSFPTGGYQDTISDGPTFHVLTGTGDAHSQGINNGGIRKQDFPYVIEVATAAPGVLTAPGLSVAPGAVTCNDADAATGWVDASDAAAMAAFESVPGSGVYDLANMIRLRSLNAVPWRSGPGIFARTFEGVGASYHLHYNLQVKTDNTANPDGEVMFIHTSRASGPLTNGTFTTADECGCTHPTDGVPANVFYEWGSGPGVDTPPNAWCNLEYDYSSPGVTEEPSTRGRPGFFDLLSIEQALPGGDPVIGHHEKLTVGSTRLAVSKKNATGDPLQVVDNGDLVTFDICWSVIGSPLEPVSNLTISDNLPANLAFVSSTLGNADSFSITGTDTLNWTYSGATPGGTSDCFQVTVEVINAAGEAQIGNTATIRAADFFGDALSGSNVARIKMLPAYERLCVYKTVADEEGPCDVYPGPGTEPADWADRCSIIYQDDPMEFTLHLLNEGLTDLGPVDVIEVFPFLGDAVEPANATGLFAGDGRAPVSDFSGTLELAAWPPAVAVDSLAGQTDCRGTFYWTTEVPDLINRNPEDPSNALTGGIWNAGTPANLATVTGFRYVMSDDLGIGGAKECRITFELDSDSNVDLDFYSNTFGAKSETIKTVNRANDVSILVREADFALTKVLADPASGFVMPGQQVTWDIEICNQGTVAATQIRMNDYIPSGLTYVDADNLPGWRPVGTPATRAVYEYITDLAPGECETIPLVLTVDASVTGIITNWAEIQTVIGPDGMILADTDSTPNFINNDPFGGDNVTDNSNGDEDDHDPAEIFVLDPCIDIEKFTEGVQSDTAPGNFIPAGSSVTWTYVVTNCGNIGLGDVTVVDDVEGAAFYVSGDTDGDGLLDTDEEWIFEAIGTSTGGAYSNNAQTSGNPVDDGGSEIPGADPVMDEDPDHYFGADPGITIEKTVYLGHDGGASCPGTELATSTSMADVTYCFVVMNTGNVTLDPVTIMDTLIGMPAMSVGPLAPGASASAFFETVIDGALTNVADVAGTPVDDDGNLIDGLDDVTDDDPAEVAEENFDLALQKVLTSSGPFNPGDDVTFTITLFNQGDVIATNIEVVDYIPTGLILNDADWADNGTSASYLETGPLNPGSMVGIPITFTIDPNAPAGTIENFAEIAGAQDDEGNPRDDIDSTPDADDTNDGPVTDNETMNGNNDEDDHDPAEVDVEIFDLALTKVIDTAATPGPYSPGDTITFTITVTNQGTMVAQNIAVADYIPAGLILADPAWSQTGPSTAEQTIAGPLAPGGSEDLAISFLIGPDVDGELVNYSEIGAADDEDGNPGNDIDSTPDTEDDNDGPVTDGATDGTDGDEDDHDPAPFTVETFDLALTKVLVGNGPFTPGGPATFEITVENQGTVTATNVQVTDYVPAGLTVNDSAWTVDGTAGPGSVTNTIAGPIAPGGTMSITIEMIIDSGFSGVITNVAEISGAQDGDGNDRDDDVDSTADGDGTNDGDFTDNATDGTNGDEDDSDPAFLPVGVFDLALTKVIDTSVTPGPYSPGDSITYLITVYNQGAIAAYNVDVVDYVPAGLILNDPAWTNVSAGTVGTSLDGPIVPNGSENVQITFTIDPSFTGGVLTNFSEIADAEDENGNHPEDLDSTPDTTNDDGDVTDNATQGEGGDEEDDHDPAEILVGIFDLALTKVVDTAATPGPYTPGDTITFTITVTNQGTVVAQNIEVSDYFPAGLTLADAVWTQTATQTAVTTIPGPLAPGGSVDLSISYTINPGVSGDLTNWGEISEAEDDMGNDRDDIDSTDDGVFGNDGDFTDNATDDPNDEDDSDPAPFTVEIFDLALTKMLTSDGPFFPGAFVEFTLEVENQGTVTAYNIGLSDAVPAGLIVADAAWDMDGTAGPVVTDLIAPLAGPLAPGDKTNIVITLQIDPAATMAASLVNTAEINGAEDEDGPRDDEDSTADDDPTNDGDATDNATDNENGDEDDSDPAELSFEIFDLALEKALTTEGPYSPGDMLTFTITLENQGTVDAQNIVVSDAPSAGLILTDTAWTGPLGGPYTYTYPGPLLAGTMDTVTITYQIDPAISGAVSMSNYAAIDGAEDTDGNERDDDIDSTEGDGSTDEDDDDEVLFDVEIFDLALTKVLDTDATPGPFQPGDTVTFEIEVFNQGTVDAQNIDVVDYVPAGLILNDAAWSASGPGIATTTIPGPVLAGDSTTVSISFTIAPGVDGPLENVAEIESAEDTTGEERDDNDSTPDGTNGNDGPHDDNTTNGDNGDEDDTDPAGITVGTFDLALVKMNNDPGPFYPGGTVTFDITVINQGTVDAFGITVADYIPPGLIVTDAAWVPNNIPGGLTSTQIAGPLAPGEQVTVQITFTIDPQLNGAITLTNHAEIASATDGDGIVRDDFDSTPDFNEDNDEEVDDVTDNTNGDEDDADPAPVMIGIFDLALVKDLSDTTPGPFTPGDLVTFVHTIENQGSVTAQNITLTDTPPAGLILTDAAWSGPTGGPYSYLYSGPLTPGLTDTVTITFQIDPAINEALSFTNTSEIASAEDDQGNPRTDDIDSTEGDGSDDQDDDDPEVISVEIFDLALTKVLNEAANPGPYSPGDLVTFTITVFNQGTMVAQNIDVVDYTPAGLTLADAAWSLTAADVATTTIPGPLNPMDSASVDITFTINEGVSGSLQNFAEISGADNDQGEPEDDIDSTPDGQNGNDGPFTDDDTDGTNGDEDDHDPADVFVEIFDLALTKALTSPGPHFPGGLATYTITLENQGTVMAQNIEVADYIPAGLALMDADWMDMGGIAYTTVAGPLAPGDTLPVEITFMIDPSFTTGVITNFAEIAGAQDGDGNTRDDDIDSDADDDDSNDGDFGDDVTDGTNGDEDDHDPAFLPIGVFDLALTKTLSSSGPFSPGDDVTFTVTVFNQGTIGAQNVTVTDYVPAGLTLNDSDWSLFGGNATALVSGPIPAGGFEEVDITFTIDAGFSGAITNVTEISSAEDDQGNPREDDIDSTPDDDNGNDGDMVDNETGNGGGDEDDSDPEVIAVGIYDLALTKVLTSTGPFNPGDDVTFTITVINQGTVAAQNVEVTDYIPSGLTLNDASWSAVAGGEAVTTIPGPIAPGDSVDVTITMTIDAGTSGELVNYSEISGGEDTDGNERDDIDSTPDSDGDNDGPVTDGATDGTNGDEDDHDPAPIFVEIFDLALTKELTSPGPFFPGAPATFTHTVENQGTVAAQNITLTDYVPAGLIVNDANWSPNGLVGPGLVTTTIAGPVAPGALITSDITFTIDPNGSTAGSAVNVSEISEAQDTDGNVRDDDDSTPDDDPTNDGNAVDNDTDNTGGDEDDSDPAQIQWEVFDLALEKNIITPGPYSPGDLVTYGITVINEGTIAAQNIALSDNPPAGLNLADSAWSGAAGGPHTMTYAGPLPAGGSHTVMITYEIDANAPAGSLQNWADIDGAEDTDGNPRTDDIDSTENDDSQDQDDDDPEQIEVSIFDLALLKEINTAATPGPYAPGDVITFTITVFNQGTVGATDIEVTDYIPAGLSLQDAAWTANGTSEAFTIIPGPLAAGDSTSVDITLLIGSVAGELVNYSEISEASDENGNPRDDIDSTPDSDQGDDNVTDGVTDGTNGDEDDHDPAPFTVEVFDLALTKVLSSPAPYVPGDDVTFTITVLNQGTIDAFNVLVTDYTPAGLTLNDAAWTETNGIAQALIAGPVPVGSGVQMDITYTIDPAFTTGQIVNFAEISGGEDADGNPRDDIDSTPDADGSNDGAPNDNNTDNLFGDEDDHDPAVLPVNVFDLALTKELVSAGPFAPGDSATFMITVYNQGSIPAQNVEVTDSIPAGLILDDAAWTETAGVATTQLDGPIVPGGSENVMITFIIDPTSPSGTLVNHAEISGAQDDQGNPRDDFDGTFDGDPTNDEEVDGEINGFGGDEDNADPAELQVGVFDLALVKDLVSPGPFDAGDSVTFEITVFNQGTVDAANIDVTDYIPAGLTLADAAWTLVSAGEAVTTIAGPLAAGDSTTVQVTLTIDAGASGDLVNFAEISEASDTNGNVRDDIDSSADGSPGNDGPYTDGVTDGTDGDEDDHDPALVSIGVFDLALVKVVASPGPFTPGDDITFEITVINQGTVDAANITVTDQLPAGLTLNDAAWTESTNGLAETSIAGILAAGSSTSVTITATIGDGITGSLQNIAEISGATDSDGNERDDIDSIADGDIGNDGPMSDDVTDGSNGDEDDHDPAEFTVDVFDLALDKALTTPGPFSPGDQVTFTIFVTNEGTVPAANIAVTEHIPAGLVLNDLNWVDNGDGTAVRMVPGTLLPGVSFPLTVSFVIANDASGQLVNIAEISGATDSDGNPRDDIDSVPDGDPSDPLAEDDHDPEPITVEVFDLALVKNLVTPGPVSWGDTVTFEVIVFNQGTVAAQNIDVVDYIPAGLSLNDTTWTKIGVNAVATVPGPIAPGGMATLSISFTVDNGVQGELVNYAEITGAEDTEGMSRDDVDSSPDADIANDGPAVDGVTDGTGGDEDDHDPASINVEIGEVDLALTKMVEGAGPFTPGDDVTFRITLYNQGEVAAELVDIVDYIPAGLTLNDDDWTDNGDGTASITYGGPIVPGASEVIRISFVIDEDFGGWLVNEAEITGATDENGNVLQDIDGTLDADATNNGTPNDNVVTDPNDTDHHDPAPLFVEIFDLALIKTVVGEGPFQTGDDLTYNIHVVNQGNTDATSVEIVDLLPTGLTLNDSDWTDNGDATASYTLAALAAGDSADIEITTTIGNGVDGMVTNYAEIAAANGPDGQPREDVDSVPDSNFGNEGVVNDNALDGTGAFNGGDEDDADPAPVMITGLSTVTGNVWTDLSADGDPSNENLAELGLEGIEVVLYTIDEDGNPTIYDTVTTGPNGEYMFDELPEGEYFISVDPENIPDSISLATTPNGYPLNLDAGVDSEANFGFTTPPTVVELVSADATLGDNGVTVSWVSGFEQDTLGFNVYRVDPAGRTKVNQALVIAGAMSYSVTDADGIGGTYVLVEITNDLAAEDLASLQAGIDATPQGPGATLMAEDGEAAFTSTGGSYLVIGFDAVPTVLDVTVPDYPVELRGETLQAGDDNGAYFEAPAGADIDVRVAE